MGCMQSKAHIPQALPPFHPISDASAMRDVDDYKKNMLDISNTMRLMMNKMEQQDRLIENLRKQKSSVGQIPKFEGEYQKLDNIGAKTIEKYKILCKQCYYSCQRFTSMKKGLKICEKCSGYGMIGIQVEISMICSKCKHYQSRTSSMNVCQDCYGRGVVLK